MGLCLREASRGRKQEIVRGCLVGGPSFVRELVGEVREGIEDMTMGVGSMEKMGAMTSDEGVQITRETNYGTWRFQKGWNPMHIVGAEGCYITDANGKKYLDFSAQLMCMNLGHKNQAVIDSIANQAKNLAYAMRGHRATRGAALSRLFL